jgi:subtilisin family serine protease
MAASARFIFHFQAAIGKNFQLRCWLSILINIFFKTQARGLRIYSYHHFMKTSTAFAVYLVCAFLLIFEGCRKTDQSAKMSQTPAPPCDPVQLFSTSSDATYIVMLRSANNENESVETLGRAEARTGTLFSRHAIQENQRMATLTSIHTGFIARLSLDQALALKQDQDVELVEKDRVIELDKGCFEIVSPSTVQWGAKRTGIADGSGKRVWVIDSGVDIDHPDLDVDTSLSKCFVPNQTSVEDSNGHGTHVAGIIGALNNSFGVVGVAFGAKIIALKVLNSDGEGTTSQIIRALNYLGQNSNPGEVVNMSLGTDTISPSLDNAVLTLAQKGILFSIAAGNKSEKANLSSPGRVNHPNVFTIAAIDSLGQFASFSNYGNDVVDWAAPGVGIVSTFSNGRYARLSGTSMAAPHVAGILVVAGKNIHGRGTALKDPDNPPDSIASY